MSETVTFQLRKDFIELDNLLKALGLVPSGAEAKQAVQAGLVKVNGQPEPRVRRKLKSGDVVEMEGKKIDVTAPPAKRDFDTAAATWDIPPRVKLANEIALAISRQIPLAEDMDVLDFGCGTGLLSLDLRPRVHSVTGADSSKGMLEAFNAKLRQGRVKGVRTIWLAPEKELSLNGPYHLIVSAMTLHHIPEPAPLLKMFYDDLRPGRYLALADLDSEDGKFHADNAGVHHNGFDREALMELARKAGFIDARCEQAAEVSKPGPDGNMRSFSIFLLTARREGE